MPIKIFYNNSITEEIKNYFNINKKPFVIKNIFESNIDLSFLKKKYGNDTVLALNKKSDKEKIEVSSLIKKILNGEKYRLRANTKLGNKIFKHIDLNLISKIKGNKKSFFDLLLSIGKSSRQKTLFLSTKNCTFSKHSHVISGIILQLYGNKNWHISKNRETFSSIKYKSLLNPNPLYVTDKNTENEFRVSLEPGDLLYMPAYWFHYTTSNQINLSFSYFFTESFFYYLKKTFLMFFYQGLRNPYQAISKAIKKEPEEHIFDRKDIIKICNKIKNEKDRKIALDFFKRNDFS